MAGVSKKQLHTWATHLWKAAMGPPGLLSGSAGGDSGDPAWQSLFPVDPLAVSGSGVC